jgi:hypothetical protein
MSIFRAIQGSKRLLKTYLAQCRRNGLRLAGAEAELICSYKVLVGGDQRSKKGGSKKRHTVHS